KAFLEFAAEDLGADYIATGHYVRRADVNGKSRLLRGLDGNKDMQAAQQELARETLRRALTDWLPLFSHRQATAEEWALLRRGE
ncbi:hypothetical protein ONK29_27510, partial [Salmonella enterica subsp. enterica serovar Anatum]|nr:hypothetical protein [Salmonella enterica subsp. enterica serovar Anatum]